MVSFQPRAKIDARKALRVLGRFELGKCTM